MHFNQIEMTGFKSFADRTVIDLQQGITSVVGPNGCGKSNILDAMRWALGEQKPKQLRGAHMQDVIFNGSEERAPMGMAEVTLTFDNADGALPIDFAEVQVTRRIYRSGESEYLINKAPCRLRDVHELFMDTGIGTNAYSMIGQGKIAMVLSSRPEDRRFLFEEAAGIIKYKSRKRIAMRKLDHADQNLLRLGDIVNEIERQMRSLKRQVNAAIRHRELTDELRGLEMRASWLKQRELVAKLDGMREHFAQSQDIYEKKSAEMSRLEAKHEELSLAKLEIDRILHARREAVHEVDTEMEKIERQIGLLRQQIEFSNDQEAKAAEERGHLETQAETARQQAQGATERLEELRREQGEVDGVLVDKQSRLNEVAARVREADARLDDARSRSVESINVRARTQTAIETLTVNIDNVEAQLATLYERQQEDERAGTDLARSLEENRVTEHRCAQEMAERDEALRVLREEQSRIRAVRDAEGIRWQSLREESGRVEARLASFRELRDSYEGFAAGVKAVMRAKSEGHPAAARVIGPVGDLIKTAPEYERAVEAVLGSRLNCIVVEYAEDARTAIAYLDSEQAGRVTFLPLDTLMESTATSPAHPFPGRALIHLVTFEDRYRRLMHHLFHETYLVDQLATAIHVLRTTQRRHSVVTLNGDVVAMSGSITGGRSASESRGLLGRTAEIEEMETSLAELNRQVEKASRALEELDVQIADSARREEEIGEQLEALRIEQTHGSAESNRLTAELERLARAGSEIAAQRETLGAKRQTFEQERRESLDAAEAIETEGETLEREMAEAQDAAAQARSDQSELSSSLADLRVHIARMAKSAEETERDHARLQRELEEAIAEAGRRNESIGEFRAQRRTLEEEIENGLERSKALAESKEEARKNVVEAENRRQALLDESDTIEKASRTLRDEVREVQNRVHTIEIDLRHDEDQLTFFRERILTEYHVALGSLSEEDVGQDELEDDAREERITNIRERLDRMGTVNLMAIEEYDALTERHEFLVGQDQDLQKARQALLDVVERIDKTITAMFVETFNAVAENFHTYFRRLFNGGQARLYLVDEDDPLESGIEIEARPPGKKPQSIALLSGGEQAMTAIALLFSIFKAKPSPFCVLDEVDAPLDDANIGRFVEMIDEFTADTQFVVITHNKQTMARADALYGVTQQERGVSQIVSVRFAQESATSTAA